VSALLVVGALAALLLLAHRNRRRIIEQLAAQQAWRLPPCTAVIRRALSWVWLPRASVYVLNDGVVVLTINGGLRIFRGAPKERLDCIAESVALDGEALVIRFSGFAAGSVSLKGLAVDDQRRVIDALK
jgi:hypothetical protein